MPVDSDRDFFGGEISQNYGYDDLYQLKTAKGTWDNRQGHTHRYTLAMDYDTIHNITAKNQYHERQDIDGSAVKQGKTTYNWVYEYGVSQPHASSHIGNRTFSYDANGNQSGWDNDDNGTRRTIIWDEENRIDQINDNGHANYYTYDAEGERVAKRTSQGETFYVNPYFVIRSKTEADKHYFIGSRRAATKVTKNESQTLVDIDFSDSDTSTDGIRVITDEKCVLPPGIVSLLESLKKEDIPRGLLVRCENNGNGGGKGGGNGGGNGDGEIIYEAAQYYYHPDHLDSASFITDENGRIYEHLEYFPFGEAFAHEHITTLR